MLDVEFGKRFEMLMKSANISNAEITEKAELSKNNVGNYKNGQIPNAQILYRLSQIFGVTMEYLLTGKEAAELSPEEQEIVDCYRATNDQGKRTILTIARSQKQEQSSSISKLG